MKNRITAFLIAILAICTLFSVTAFAEDEVSLDLATFQSFRGMNGKMNNGVLELEVIGYQATKESPAIWIPPVTIDASKYRYVKVVMKSNTDTTVPPTHNIYFKTEAATSYSEARKITLNINKTEDYVTYTFDMAVNSDWYGTVTGIFYQIEGDAKGTASIKSISFVEGTPIKKIILADEEKITDLPENAVIKYESKFAKSKDYTDSFADVGFNDWFYEAVGSAYEFGLVNGSSESSYEPNGTMTVAEAVTLACRMYGVVNGKTLDVKNGEVNWYDGYVAYAKEAGFLADGDFDSYDREIKRYEMVTLFASALPAECFEELNYVTHIPDIANDAEYADDILMFYNAGICMGNDIYGTFSPESNITRAEVAAIVDRIADHSHRLDKDLAVKVDANAAYYIIDESDFVGRNTISQSIKSGWDYDNRGGMVKTDDEPPYSLADINNTEPVTLTRNVTVQDAGVVTLESAVRFNSEINGWYAQINSSSGLPVAKLYTENGKFNILDNGVAKPLDFEVPVGKSIYYRLIMDLATKTFSVDINSADYGTYSFSNAYATDIAQLKLGTTEQAVMDTTVSGCRMYCNYLVNDNIPTSIIRHDWTVTQDGDMTVVANGGEFQFNGNTGKASVANTFKAASGEIALDLIMLYPEMADGAEIAFTSGGTPVVSFTTKEGKMYANGKELREYDEFMWYMVRLVANTDTQKALIKVSGKTVATDVPFAVSAATVDGILISSENNGGKILRIDDIEVQKLPVYADYPSEPVVPEGADDYYIGMNVCNLWKNGYHWGWDNISPYDENKPYLGWYDEGLPEVADWEIKFMAEHGIDFQLVCWYHSSERPMKTFYGSTPEAVFSGFMNAKYSDEYGKIALLWEAGNGQKPTSFEDFKTNFVPFWIEYFFSDPRYMVIDNKLVMSIFGIDSLKSTLGSEAAVKELLDYLSEVARDLGYDDIIIMACSGSSDQNTLKNLAAMGVDAVHAYNWGNSGYSATVNQNNIFSQQKNGQGVIHNVPTVSTGFNNIAWAYTRHPQLTTDNMKQVLTWIRDYTLNNYEVTGENDKWKQNFIMLSTWNEYGEGTFMMPAGLNGFGYVDTIREVFTKGDEKHDDERPDNLQMARLGHLYPINREIIRPDGYYEAPISGNVVAEDTFTGSSASHWKNSHSTVKEEGDVLSGVATDHDPILNWTMPFGSLDAATIKHIRVYVDGVVGNSVEVFWQREDDQTWTAAKGTSAKITKEGMNPVVIDVAANANWKGTITSFRVDPITSANPFKIQKIEFLGEPPTETVQINGQTIKFDVNPVNLENGDKLIPFFPDTGIGYQLGCAYTWDKVNKKLTLAKNGNTIVYTMGSDRASINGVLETLECTPYLEDGLPMIPMLFTAEKLGCEYETKVEEGINVINIISVGGEAYKILSNRVANQWEFEISGDTEGWSLQAATASVMDGNFIGNNEGHNTSQGSRYDAALSSPTLSFQANRYKTLKIRMKHEIDVEKNDANKGEFELKVYFKTSTAGLAEARTYKVAIDQTSGGEFVEYEFKLDHEQWTGLINGIRVDPFNNVPGEFWIDYIRFE